MQGYTKKAASAQQETALRIPRQHEPITSTTKISPCFYNNTIAPSNQVIVIKNHTVVRCWIKQLLAWRSRLLGQRLAQRMYNLLDLRAL